MSTDQEADIVHLLAQNERLHQEIDRLRAENKELRACLVYAHERAPRKSFEWTRRIDAILPLPDPPQETEE